MNHPVNKIVFFKLREKIGKNFMNLKTKIAGMIYSILHIIMEHNFIILRFEHSSHSHVQVYKIKFDAEFGFFNKKTFLHLQNHSIRIRFILAPSFDHLLRPFLQARHPHQNCPKNNEIKFKNKLKIFKNLKKYLKI